MTLPRRPKSGRKSLPHSLTQCTSSTTNSDGGCFRKCPNASPPASCSGARNRYSSLPFAKSSQVSRTFAAGVWLLSTRPSGKPWPSMCAT